jgi:hypothetical protein
MEQIVGRRWFSGRDCVGAVLVKVDEKFCAYIGKAEGGSEDADIKSIRSWGARLPFNVAAAMFPNVDELFYSEESI